MKNENEITIKWSNKNEITVKWNDNQMTIENNYNYMLIIYYK